MKLNSSFGSLFLGDKELLKLDTIPIVDNEFEKKEDDDFDILVDIEVSPDYRHTIPTDKNYTVKLGDIAEGEFVEYKEDKIVVRMKYSEYLKLVKSAN